MTPEQKQQRIEQIRERQSGLHADAQQLGDDWCTGTSVLDDIDFLLSLVKSQEVQLDGYKRLLDSTEDHNEQLLDAATSMRSACVEKVKELADEWLRHGIAEKDAGRARNLRLSYNVAQTIIGELETVALEGQERSAQVAAIERCLRQVKIMRVNWQDGMRWPHQGDLLDEVISRMESLTLQEQEAKQS